MNYGGLLMKVIRQEKDIHDDVMDRYARHLALKNEADLAYIAMMTDVDMPVEETTAPTEEGE